VKKTLTMGLVLAALPSLGCFSRAHLTEHYGRAYRQAFERQIANPGAAANAKVPKGLDALEAGIVVETYRTQLAPHGGGQSAEQPMILLSPQTGGFAPAPTISPASK
jgi:hypothetical protein